MPHLDDLKDRRLAARRHDGAAVAKTLTSAENLRLAAMPLGAVVDLMNSQADGVILDEQPAIIYERMNPELQLVRLAFDEEFYGVAVRKGNAELLAQVNETLAEIIADGRCDRYVHDWLVQMVDIRAGETDDEPAE